MKKIILLVIISFSLSNIVLAQQTRDVSDDIVPYIGNRCAQPKSEGGFGGTCVSTNHRWSGTMCEAGTQDFIGVCQMATVVTNEHREDCCVPKGSVTDEEIASKQLGQWVSSTVCERPRSEGGIGGKCLTANSGLNPFQFSDSCSSYSDTPRFAGTCGSRGWGAASVCCVSQAVATEVTGNNGAPLAIGYGDYQLLEQIPGSSNTSGKLQPYLESLYKAGFVLIVLGAVIMIGFGGFTYMASAGNTSMIKKGKGMITDAIIGLVAALLIWLILNIINPDLVNLKIDPLPQVSFDPGRAGATTAAGNNAAEGVTSTLSAQEAARKLLAHSRVTLGTSSGDTCPGGNASAKNNLEQVAAGNGMTRCPCGGGGSTPASEVLLNSLVDIAEAGANIRINYIAGACHSTGSSHYQGTAADIQRTPELDAFFARYTRVDNGPTYQVSGVKVWFEDSSHYHVSLTGR